MFIVSVLLLLPIENPLRSREGDMLALLKSEFCKLELLLSIDVFVFLLLLSDEFNFSFLSSVILKIKQLEKVKISF